MKVGDKVRWNITKPPRVRLPWRKMTGAGVVVRVYEAMGNCPETYEVDTFKGGVLFADELRRA